MRSPSPGTQPTTGSRSRVWRLSLSLALATLGLLQGCHDGSDSPLAPADNPTIGTASALAPLVFKQLATGTDHACGLTTDERAYCWGANFSGELGDGTSDNHSTPVAVLGELTFRQISVGSGHTCGLTPAGRLYCWGLNGNGQLGDGTTTSRPTPTSVAGDLQFTQVSAGGAHTCALAAPNRRAYCWGWNGTGQVGDFTTTSRLTPVAVVGGHQFRQVSAGSQHTCAVSAENAAYCWGRANQGQIGDGFTVARRKAPKLVAGGHAFQQVEAGVVSTCGVTTSHRAFCWGYGGEGQLGNGSTASRNVPGPVAGGLAFDRVTVGEAHACAEASNNRAYCWGENSGGRLGIGEAAAVTRLKPVAVQGGLQFTQLTAGPVATCGTTDSGTGYCWGFNTFGQLGDGTTTSRSKPTPVVGPM